MAPPTTVFLIVPNLPFASLLCEILLQEPNIYVVGEAESYEAALNKLSRAKPEWVILDYCLPDIRALEAIPGMVRLVPHARFVLLYDDDDIRYRAAAAKTGAVCVRKDHVATDLIASIREADRHLEAA